MTTTTLHMVGSLADSAVDRERHILNQRRDDEQRASQYVDGVRAEIERLRQVEAQASNDLAAAGRAVMAQEQRVSQVEARMLEKAKELQALMDELGLQALPPQPQQTVPDELGVGDVPPTEREEFYAQQAAAQGAPATMTQPVPTVMFEGDPTEQHRLPDDAAEIASTESPSGAHEVARTGNQPTGTPKGRGRR